MQEMLPQGCGAWEVMHGRDAHMDAGYYNTLLINTIDMLKIAAVGILVHDDDDDKSRNACMPAPMHTMAAVVKCRLTSPQTLADARPRCLADIIIAH